MKHLLSLLSPLLAFALMLPFYQAWANDINPEFNRISFSETVSQQVINDQVTARFLAEAQAADPKDVGQAINRKMQQARQRLANSGLPKGSTIETGDYRITPVYDSDQKIKAWRGQQALTIVSRNPPGLAKRLAELQDDLNFNRLDFSVSTERQAEVRAQLLQTAIQSYRDKAARIAHAFGEKTFRLTETQIQDSSPGARLPQTRMMMSAVKAEAAAPVLEAGQTEIRITVSGVLVLPNPDF